TASIEMDVSLLEEDWFCMTFTWADREAGGPSNLDSTFPGRGGARAKRPVCRELLYKPSRVPVNVIQGVDDHSRTGVGSWRSARRSQAYQTTSGPRMPPLTPRPGAPVAAPC